MSNPQEAWQRLAKMANQAGRGGGGPSPRGMAGGFASLLLLGGAVVVGNNALFNVDGGHRAIKYTRIGGVSKEIYSEGLYNQYLGRMFGTYNYVNRHSSQNPLV